MSVSSHEQLGVGPGASMGKVERVIPRGHVGEVVCWSRMQSEAGQGLEAIMRRKELERRSGQNKFMWGVGSPPGSRPGKLAEERVQVPIVFSTMKSLPKAMDSSPSAVWVWRAFVDGRGRRHKLPEHSLVTSRGSLPGGPIRRHYALVCESRAPISLGDHGGFDHHAFRNLGGANAPVGASQVTALLRRARPDVKCDYRINLAATLVDDLWVRVSDPAVLPARKTAALDEVTDSTAVCEWLDLVTWCREGPGLRLQAQMTQLELL